MTNPNLANASRERVSRGERLHRHLSKVDSEVDVQPEMSEVVVTRKSIKEVACYILAMDDTSVTIRYRRTNQAKSLTTAVIPVKRVAEFFSVNFDDPSSPAALKLEFDEVEAKVKGIVTFLPNGMLQVAHSEGVSVFNTLRDDIDVTITGIEDDSAPVAQAHAVNKPQKRPTVSKPAQSSPHASAAGGKPVVRPQKKTLHAV